MDPSRHFGTVFTSPNVSITGRKPFAAIHFPDFWHWNGACFGRDIGVIDDANGLSAVSHPLVEERRAALGACLSADFIDMEVTSSKPLCCA